MEKTKRTLEQYRDNLAIFSSIGQVEQFTEAYPGVSDSYRKEYALTEIDSDRIDAEIGKLNHAIATLDHILNLHENGKDKK